MQNRKVGVLDSGVGGLTVLKEIIKKLPQESTIYIGDSQNAPYGKRSPAEIQSLAIKLIQFLLTKNVKLIVIACNTITVNGIDTLRKKFPQVPLIGTVPVIKKAAQRTKKKKIGLLATEATAKSAYMQKLLQEFGNGVEVITVGTNELVPLIESHNFAKLQAILPQILQPFLEKEIDVLILGSTHFPIITKEIGSVFEEKLVILDSGEAIALQTKRILTNKKLLARVKNTTHEIYTTGDEKLFAMTAQNVLDKKIIVKKVVLQ